jgi:hypothetical protein
MTTQLTIRSGDYGAANCYLEGVKCDRCLTLAKPPAKNARDWSSQLAEAGWRARKRNNRYRHACPKCADQFLRDYDQGLRLF